MLLQKVLTVILLSSMTAAVFMERCVLRGLCAVLGKPDGDGGAVDNDSWG